MSAERLARARARHDKIARHMAELLDANERDPNRREQLELDEATIELGRALAGLPVSAEDLAGTPACAAGIEGQSNAGAVPQNATPQNATPRCGARRGGLACTLERGHAGRYHATDGQTWVDRVRRAR